MASALGGREPGPSERQRRMTRSTVGSTSLTRLFRLGSVTPSRTFEGALAAEHLVENQAQRLEIAANRNLAAGQLLGLPKSFVAHRRGYHSTRFLISFNMS
jgi:hypothetical protein